LNEIVIAALTTCHVSPNGSHIRLDFEDSFGRASTLRLTSASVQQLVMTLPQLLSRALNARHPDRSARAVFPLEEWRVEAAAGTKDLILTMATPDGFEVSFSVSAPAITGMTSALEEHLSITCPPNC
jgi:hypothetical protein